MKADPRQTPPNLQDRRKPFTGPSAKEHSNGLRVFCCNCNVGGLGGGMCEELLHFSDESHCTVALIQESK